jgi:hypothetical protein
MRLAPTARACPALLAGLAVVLAPCAAAGPRVSHSAAHLAMRPAGDVVDRAAKQVSHVGAVKPTKSHRR